MVDAGSILFVDAYDSFSENIIALLRDLLQVSVTTIQINGPLAQRDASTRREYVEDFDAIVLGPGPGDPRSTSDTGLFDLIWDDAQALGIPVLGICLGFQSLCTKFGLDIVRTKLPCHGHAKAIIHEDVGIFKSTGDVVATCYNSLAVSRQSCSAPGRDSGYSSPARPSETTSDLSADSDIYEGKSLSNPSCRKSGLRLLAWDSEGYAMAVQHERLPFHGLQFHPESCMSNSACHKLVQNWWAYVQHVNAMKRSLHKTGRSKTDMCAGSKRDWHKADKDVVKAGLRHLTEHCGQQVFYRTTMLAGDTRAVADLCHSLSPDGVCTMLESTKHGRFSIYAFPDSSSFRIEYCKGHLTILKSNSVALDLALTSSEALDAIEELLLDSLAAGGPPKVPFWGGLIGYHSYELGLDLLNVSTADDHKSRSVPDLAFLWVDRSVVVDNETGLVYAQSLRLRDAAWLDFICSELSLLSKAQQKTTASSSRSDIILPCHDLYISSISTCQSQLHAGNSYELCLTTSTTLASTRRPYALYTSLQTTNPAPYSAFLSLDKTQILSSSPESFLTLPRPTLTTTSLDLMMTPMKGTLRKQLHLTISDASRLLRTPKEEAENLMIVDLIRHDLNRTISSGVLPGHVTVDSLFDIVETETLYQLISRITATIPFPPPPSSLPSTSPPPLSSSLLPTSSTQTLLHTRQTLAIRTQFRALRHTLPAGSMTGAPKKRSCEILRKLEGRNRGVYSGVIGYFDVGGGGDWSVAIRCAFSCGDEDEQTPASDRDGNDERKEEGGVEKVRKWHVGAGGAITVLSEKEAEWEEMRGKMRGVLRGLGCDEV